jgi:hypothetical protein
VASAAKRRELAALMDYLVRQEPRVHYGQVRPMASRSIRTLAELHAKIESRAGITLDCSESVTLLCKLAGLADPNGLRYDGAGNTETMLGHLPHYYSARSAGIGALVVFGVGRLETEHVCMVRKPGGDPLLFSHGQERGPFLIPLSVEKRYHVAPYTFLSIAHL